MTPSSTIAEGAPRPLALTLGEPGGIGPEITIRSWAERERLRLPAFCLFAPPALVEKWAARLDMPVPVRAVDRVSDAAAVFPDALPVLTIEGDPGFTPGRADPATGRLVIRSIEAAVAAVRKGDAAAVVTNPIHKAALYDAGFRHPGHTEFLAALCADGSRAPTPVMMLAIPGLRVVPLTVHVPLKDVASHLTSDHIVTVARILHQSLSRDFGIAKPRIAVAGLNPHAGEDGRIGSEEQTIIAPAVAALRAEGLDVSGPRSADSMFHTAARTAYDAALCMYHDQALIPLKALDFDNGVNVTLGLPVVRTSPDHGTALDIAGRGIASPASLVAALRLAAEMASTRARA